MRADSDAVPLIAAADAALTGAANST